MNPLFNNLSSKTTDVPPPERGLGSSVINSQNREIVPPGILKKRYIKDLGLNMESTAKDPRTENTAESLTPQASEPKWADGCQTASVWSKLTEIYPQPFSLNQLTMDKFAETTERVEKADIFVPAAASSLTSLPAFVEVHVNKINLNENEFLAETIDPKNISVHKDFNVKIFDQHGELLVIYIKNAIDIVKYDPLFEKMYAYSAHSAYFHSVSRGAAAGKFDPSLFPTKDSSKWNVDKNGYKATYEGQTFKKGNTHKSGTIGYLGHNNNRILKRRIAGMGDELLPEVESLLNRVAEIYKSCAPERHDNQLKALEKHRVKAQELNIFHGQIGKTPFTTLTINVSVQGKPTTYVHRDKTNLKDSFVAVFVDGGNYTGGETAFPELRDAANRTIAFSVRPGDLLFFDGSKLLHGNTPVHKLNDLGDRVSFVAYAQETLASCVKCKPQNDKKPQKK